MALEDFRAKAYVANVNAGHVGGYLESGQMETVETVKTTTFDRVSLVTARFHADDMVEHLTVAYWIDGTPEDSGYHKSAAVAAYNKLTEILKNNGMLQ